MGLFRNFTFLCAVGLICCGQVSLAGESTRGEIIYRGYCAVCHGPTGKGDGISAPALLPTPPDLTQTRFRLQKDSVWEIILNGKEGTQMEAFRDKISPEDVEAVIEYIFTLK